jgi:hypothetical protein
MGFFRWLLGFAPKQPKGPYPIIRTETGEVFNFNVEGEYSDRYMKSQHWNNVRTWSMAGAVPRKPLIVPKNWRPMPKCQICGKDVTLGNWIGHHPDAESYNWVGRERKRDVRCVCKECHPGRGTNHIRLHQIPGTNQSFVPNWASSRGIDFNKPGTIRKGTKEYQEYQQSLRK